MSYYMSRVEEELQSLSKELRRMNNKAHHPSKKEKNIIKKHEETYWVFLPISNGGKDI